MPDLSSFVVGLCVALVPAAVRLWTGRSLARAPEDAAIGERLLATQKVNFFALVFAIVFLLMMSGPSAAWLLPLAIAAYIAAAYPLRRALYEETWGLAAYLSFTIRLLIAAGGFWIVLPAAPPIAAAAGARDWMVSAFLAAVLWLWNARSVDVFRALMRARPLLDRSLLARFEGIARVAGIATPRFEQVEMRGGVLANAVALASLRGNAVVFTDMLLSRLTPDESAAICAHEIAHLECFDPARLRRLNRVAYALVAAGAVLPTATRVWQLPSVPVWVCWGASTLAALIWIARDRQKNETSSDLRAVALTGDAEALVRGLMKGYAIARMPRRLHPEVEKRATHPSLARRIRDIREAAGAQPATLDAAATFAGLDGRTVVSFQVDRLQWIEGEVATHGLSYSHLTELRVHAARTGSATLVAVESGGRRWEMPLDDAEVARLQGVLDVVDGRVARSAPKTAVWPQIARAVSALLAFVTLLVAQFAAVLVALIGLARPSPPILAAAGAGGLSAAILVLRDQGFGGDASRITIGILCATFAAGAVISAIALRRCEEASGAPLLVALLALAALPALALLLLEGRGIVRLHMWARSIPAASVLPLSCAAALAFSRGRAPRWLASATAAIGVAVIGAGSPAFLDAFAQDPLLLPARSPAWKTIGSRPIREFPVPFPVAEARISPSADHVAIIRVGGVDDEMGGLATSFHVGRLGGPLARIPADDLVFLSDDHLLTLQRRADGVDLRRLSAEAPHDAGWELHVPNIVSPELSVDPVAGRWHLLGVESGQVVRVEGDIGGSVARRSIVGQSGGALFALAAAGQSAVAVESIYEPSTLQSLGFWQLAMFLPLADMDSRIWLLDARGRRELGASRAEVRCVSEQIGAARLVCAAFDGTRSRVVTLDPASGRVVPLAALKGRFFAHGRAMRGWLAGWHDAGPLALRLDAAEAIRIESDSSGARPTSLTVVGRMAAGVIYGDPDSVVRLYAIEE